MGTQRSPHKDSPSGEESSLRPLILLVEDEEDILELVQYNLQKERYRVRAARSGEEALKVMEREEVDLVVLDLLLPGIDGFEVCRRLRRDPRHAGTPILMLTARSEESDIVTGLELGAEDYVTKPFSPRVLLARIRTLLRRGTRSEAAEPRDQVLRYGDLEIDSGRHEVTLRGAPLQLTLTEFRILQVLSGRPGWVYTRGQLLQAATGADTIVLDRTVDVHMASLRRKLGPYGERLETVRGVGYRLRDPSSEDC